MVDIVSQLPERFLIIPYKYDKLEFLLDKSMFGLSFYMKDLYLVTTQKLTVKSVAVFMKTTAFHENCNALHEKW